MAIDQSIQTMLQGAFVVIDEAQGRYGIQISGLNAGEGGVPVEVSIPFAARSTSVIASGEASAPAADGLIAETAALDSGTWEVEITASIGGTTVAALESFNMEVLFDGESKGRVIVPVSGTAGGAGVGTFKARYDGDGIIRVQAADAATASSHYAATIVATRIN